MANLMIQILFLLLLAFVSLSKSVNHRDDNFDEENFNELKRELINHLEEKLYSKNFPESVEIYNNDLDPEYRQFFSSILTDDNDSKEEGEEEVISNRSNRLSKRFLKSLIESFFSKNRTKPREDFFDNEYDRTTPRPIFIKSNSPSTYSYQTTKQYEVHSATDDAFYKLKMHCARNYDDLCYSKRKEMYELVKKCDRLNNKHKGANELKVCQEVISIYCYVYFTRDLLTCFGTDYEQYIPGKKNYLDNNQITSTTTTRFTPSTRRISINIVTTPKSTSSNWYKPIIISKTASSTTSTTTTTRKPSTAPLPGSNSNNSDNPFEGSVIAIPNDAEKLKKIGNYCLRTKVKEPNCDKMLILLKEKFKTCEKKPKIDQDCQTFKFQFCSAFTNFPCCPDVLAGRTCSGKSI